MNTRGMILSLLTISSYANISSAVAITRDSVKVFDGKNVQCSERADVGNPAVVVSKTGQVTQEDGILVSFVVASKVCALINNKVTLVDSLPVQRLPNGVTLENHRIVVGPLNQMDIVQPLAEVELDLRSTKTMFDVLVPKTLAGKTVDSYVVVSKIDNFGPSVAWFGGFRHRIR